MFGGEGGLGQNVDTVDALEGVLREASELGNVPKSGKSPKGLGDQRQ